ncbi:hypothetical protein CDIK_2640, partial [Cucumispora dikerogammari]
MDLIMSSYFSIAKVSKAIQELEFGCDPVNISDYIKKRLKKSTFYSFLACDFEKISPELNSDLKLIPATSIAVERSFSLLNKLLERDRNFASENIGSYIIGYYNFKVDD